jgi:hypothetical protein
MSRKLWLALIASLWALPAFADYVDVLPGDTHPNCLWQGSFKPVPGVNCPAGSTVFPWVPTGTDKSFAHWSVVNGKLVYTPPAPPAPPPAPPKPPPPPPQPNAVGMETAIMQDKNISDATKLLLTPYFPTITANQTNAALLGPLWTAIKNTGKLSANEIALIESYSNIYVIPLQGAQLNGIRPRTIHKGIARPQGRSGLARVLRRP